MSIIAEMGELLCAAAGIIQRQAALLEMHGIQTEDGKLERDTQETLEGIRQIAGTDENRRVCCGRVIPEGRQVCPLCERR